MWKSLVAAVLFIAFIPGVVVTLPSKTSSKTTVLIVHALLFGFVLHAVMRQLRHEFFGNYGPLCPNGYISKGDECVAVGQATYDATTGFQQTKN